MSKSVYTTHFELDELWVRGDALGLSAEFTRDGFEVTVRLPASESDFRIEEVSGFQGRGAFGHSASGARGEADHVQTVRVIEISVARETAENSEEGQRADVVLAFLLPAQALARSIATEFVQWMRVRLGQTWLGMSHSEPATVGLRTLYDVTDGVPIRRIIGDPVELRELSVEQAVDPELVADLGALLSDGHPAVPLSDALIADARHLMRLSPSNPQQAVLLAAVGLEVAVKATLRSKTDAVKLPLLDYILSNPRDVSQQAHALFDTTMSTAIDRSLKSDNRPLFIRVGKLFEWRNKVAHTGSPVPPEVAKDLAEAAYETLGWLSSL